VLYWATLSPAVATRSNVIVHARRGPTRLNSSGGQGEYPKPFPRGTEGRRQKFESVLARYTIPPPNTFQGNTSSVTYNASNYPGRNGESFRHGERRQDHFIDVRDNRSGRGEDLAAPAAHRWKDLLWNLPQASLLPMLRR